MQLRLILAILGVALAVESYFMSPIITLPKEFSPTAPTFDNDQSWTNDFTVDDSGSGWDYGDNDDYGWDSGDDGWDSGGDDGSWDDSGGDSGSW